MIWDYLKATMRNLLRRKVHSLVNLLGLAIGLAAVLLILLWVQDEFSFDRFHRNGSDIYRICARLRVNEKSKELLSATSAGEWAPGMKAAFPEIVDYVRLGRRPKTLVKSGEKAFFEERIIAADPSFLELFTFPLLAGDPKTALSGFSQVVITQSMATKYFGKANPLGQRLNLQGMDYVVSGVSSDAPANSHIQFDFICPFESLRGELSIDWGSDNFSSYVQLKSSSSDMPSLETKATELIRSRAPILKSFDLRIVLQPLAQIHLDTQYITQDNNPGDRTKVYAFLLIAVLIMLIACANFINLTTAQASDRFREIGIRKTLGSTRAQLIWQFYGESTLMVLLAFLSAILLAELFLPAFNGLAGKQIALNVAGGRHWFMALLLLMLTSIIAGGYPAFHLSAYSPIAILKKGAPFAKGVTLRRVLVILQFSISIILIAFTLLMSQQLNFIKTRDLGFLRQNLLWIPAADVGPSDYGVIKNRLLRIPNISVVTAKNSLPTIRANGGIACLEGHTPDHYPLIEYSSIDHDYIKALDLKIVAGRNFSRDFSSDPVASCLVNEETLKVLGTGAGVGARIMINNGEFRRIIGVIKNAYFWSLRQAIDPQIFLLQDAPCRTEDGIIIVRIASLNGQLGDTHFAGTVANIKNAWEELYPGRPFEYHFLDDSYDSLYKAEKQMGQIYNYFSFLAIFVSCLGLFGLASLAAQKRTKEIGIRKVLGSSVGAIVFMLLRDFSKCVLIANIIAFPIAYYAMAKWLENFSYHISITWWLFALAGVSTLLMAGLTVSYHALRAAIANPVESLRYE